MKEFLFALPLIFIGVIFYYRLKQLRTNRRGKKYLNGKISQWMQMSREQRNANDVEEKLLRMKRKKVLIDEIRKEYKNLRTSKHK